MTYAIVACARNEGPFLVEWLAHHLSIGFDKIFVATNDCEDGTDEILDCVGRQWPVFRIDNSVPLKNLSFQRSAIRRCLRHQDIGDQDWLLHIDLDEFLNIHDPDPDVGRLMSDFEDYDALMICWRLFGDNAQEHWDGGSIIDSFLTCQNDFQNVAHKSFFRRHVFRNAAPHSPKRPTKKAEDLRVVNTNEELLDARKAYLRSGTSLEILPEQLTWARVSINHYVHKSHDLTNLTREHRGDANGKARAQRKRTVGAPFYNSLNRNDVLDTSIQSNRDRRIETMNAMFKTPGVLKAHYESQAWFKSRILAGFGKPPRNTRSV